MQVNAQLQSKVADIEKIIVEGRNQIIAFQSRIIEFSEELEQTINVYNESHTDIESKYSDLSNRLAGFLEEIPEDRDWLSNESLIIAARQEKAWTKIAPLLRAISESKDATSGEIEVAGDIADKAGARSIALQLYTQATHLDPENVSARIELSRLTATLKSGDEREDALVELKILVRESDHNRLNITKLTNTLLTLRRFHELREFCEQYIQDTPGLSNEIRSQLLRDWAVASSRLGDQSKPLELYSEALDLTPDDENLLVAYALFQREQGYFQEARDLWFALVNIDPTDPRYYIRLAELDETLKLYDSAESWATRGRDVATKQNDVSAVFQTGNIIRRLEFRRTLESHINTDNKPDEQLNTEQ